MTTSEIRAKKLVFQRARTRYQFKRRSFSWVNRKRNNKIQRASRQRVLSIQKSKPFVSHIAPKVFSLVNNTNETLRYFEEAGDLFKKKQNIRFDIRDIDNITPDAISLLVAIVNDKEFLNGCRCIGNAPIKEGVREVFIQSGFYNFVASRGLKKTGEGNFLYKEMNTKVVPTIARKAALTGIRYTFGHEKPYEPLYDILIECMSNTNNHASLKRRKKCKWWLYAYNQPSTNITSYCFLDLGVGIFDSMVFQSFLNRFFKGNIFNRNIDYAEDLLAGRIQSRADEDNEIRGKGIPQIVEHSKLDTFKNFHIITNDVKMNLKTFAKDQLDFNFKGTFLYWEIQPFAA